MAHPENRLSTEPVVADYIDPNGRTDSINEDWEGGPIAVQDTSEGMNYQAWHLTFAGGIFTITPETTGTPVDVLTGQDSIQCSLAFDQNARPTIAWETAANQGKLYWYDTEQADFVITDFQTQIWGLAITLDDKRKRQVASNDILLYYTIPNGSGGYKLEMRRQRDRFTDLFLQKDPAWPYIHKRGMNKGGRMQLTMSTESP